MKKVFIGIAIVIGLIALTMTTSTSFARQPGCGNGTRPERGGPETSLIVVAAEQLNMTSTELIAELQSGKSIAQIAQAQGVDVDIIIEEFLAQRAKWLDTLVAEGRLTEEQAAKRLEMMRVNVTERIHQTDWTTTPGTGRGFVDEDGDGVCDNRGSGPRVGGPGGQGRGRGMR
ncbi:MAG: hypothetical protein GFH27_549361n3 [Chloroflexi bacterium AL-W]|nr:hypothetical protein [Chloroflexi bacterium AL-N1]NOK70715.1 hypothetical protein [Chloroflexi bacterium AL-N10]NOK78275.1 hypothetical protein [Chloroflexi bacterium AL-N5]NOK85618.1 hypothetical protein [Chloroflexi bacterium AL-W]NOK92532.1 hypothetical protein [Chloroflexi bacterium AL-N15]